jgi:hypothetical protein
MSGHKNWTQHLQGISHCRFPKRNDGSESKTGVAAVDVDLRYNKKGLVNQDELCAAWGLVLRLYTGTTRIAFAAVTQTPDNENRLSAAPFNLDIEGEMSIARLTEDCGLQVKKRVELPTQGETWAVADGFEPPFNTLVLVDAPLGVTSIETLHKTVSTCTTTWYHRHLTAGAVPCCFGVHFWKPKLR